MVGPLAGLRILDLTTIILGPYATQILGDLGADIIKVESPEGDTTRYITPGRTRGMSGTSLNINRNKRSIVLDLKQPAARDALLKLAEGADGLIHNIRPQAMARLGLGYDDVAAVKQDIVYCACVGFGHDGPYSGRPAYDDLIQGASGTAALNARMHDEPLYFPGVMADKITGLAAVNAMVAAFLHRERTGEGQDVEVPMFETLVSFNMAEHCADFLFEPPEAEFGYARVLTPNRRPYPTKDGYVCMLPYNDRQMARFFSLISQPGLIDDPRFCDIGARARNIHQLYGLIAEASPAKTTQEWLDLCLEANIPASPVFDLNHAREEPHLKATGFLTPREHPTEGRYLAVGIPPRFSNAPCGIRRDAPNLGEHSAEVLREAGFSDEDVAEMAASGATVLGGEAEAGLPS